MQNKRFKLTFKPKLNILLLLGYKVRFSEFKPQEYNQSALTNYQINYHAGVLFPRYIQGTTDNMKIQVL